MFFLAYTLKREQQTERVWKPLLCMCTQKSTFFNVSLFLIFYSSSFIKFVLNNNINNVTEVML